jgi:hypothetical protein
MLECNKASSYKSMSCCESDMKVLLVISWRSHPDLRNSLSRLLAYVAIFDTPVAIGVEEDNCYVSAELSRI